MPFDNTTYLEPAADPEVVEQPDPYSLDTFIAWLETMPGEGTYHFVDVRGRCLLGQYATAMNRRRPWCLRWWRPVRWQYLNWVIPDARFSEISNGRPLTFGAALERAKAARS